MSMHVHYIDHLDLRASHLQKLFRSPRVQAQEALYADPVAYLKLPSFDDDVQSNIRLLERFGYGGSELEVRLAQYTDELTGKIKLIREPLVALYERAKAKEPPKLRIHRAMHMYNIDDLRRGRVGLYWADNARCASAYWGEGGEEYRITAEVDPDDVDWVATVAQRIIYNEDECEVTLRPGTKISLIQYKDQYGDVKKFDRDDREAVAGLRRS